MELNLKRRELVQGLRGIAIILVVAHHAISNFNSVALWNSFAQFFDMFHVNIFFFIAGYLFMEHREKYEKQGFRTFITRKAKSIFLPYYVLTFLFSVCVKIGFMVPHATEFLKQKGYFEKNLLNMLLDPLLFHNPYFISLWFIYVLFIYFILAWFHSRLEITMQSMIALTLATMLVNGFCYGYYPDVVYKFIRYYPYFALGMMFSKAVRETVYLGKREITIAAICLFAIAFRVFNLDISFMHRSVKAIYMQTEWLLCALSALVVLAVFVEVMQRKRKGKLLVYIGDKSYHIYLLHNPWIIIPVAVVSSSFISNVTINIVVNFAFGIIIPIIIDTAYNKLVSWGKNNDNQNKKHC